MDSIRELKTAAWSRELPLLAQIPCAPKDVPERLFVRGTIPAQAMTVEDALAGSGFIYMTVVGSRRCTPYGKEACETLIKGLRGLPVVIVSGLAFGIDSIAHRAALDAGLKTVAVPGSGLDDATVYPASHLALAREIVEGGGALVSPFPEGARGTTWMFPFRNRIMAGVSHTTLVIEADIKSGTLITSKHATEFNRDVFVVPGSIFSRQSDGPHQLLRLGATPIGSPAHLREALGFPDDDRGRRQGALPEGMSETEKRVLAALAEPLAADDIVEALGISANDAGIALSTLEMKGAISHVGSRFRLN